MIISIIAFFIATVLGARADTRIDERAGIVTISGSITDRDSKTMRALSSKLAGSNFHVFLESTGGDVFAAIEIGRIIRKYEGTTVIGPISKCYSSCALVFIAGVHRVNSGEIGLHRPYLASAPQTREKIETQVPAMLAVIKNYVAEMGITNNFYQEMVNTDSSQIAIFRADYRKMVSEWDPVYQEVQFSYDARRYGVTTAKMRERERDAEGCLDRKTTGEIYDCQEAIRWGLSERIFRERYSELIKSRICEGRDDEINALRAVSRNEQRNHPFWVKGETCQRNFMLRLNRR